MTRNHRQQVVWISRSPNEIYLNLADKLASHFDVTFICRRASHLLTLAFPHSRFIYEPLPYYNNVLNPVSWWRDVMSEMRQSAQPDQPSFIWLKQLGQYLKACRPDFIIANGLEQPAVWQAIYYCLRHNIPLLLQTEMKRYPTGLVPNIGARALLKSLRPAFARAHAILPWTQGAYRFAARYFPPNIRQKLHLLPAGIDPILFHPSPAWQPDRNSKVIDISLVARFVPYKRHLDAIKAVKLVRDQYHLDCRLSLVGKDQHGAEPLGNQLRKYVTANHLQETIYFKERVERSEMADFYQRHDINLLTSIDEPIGMVVPEAMACGVPNIVSTSCGATTYITPGVNGLIYPTGNITALAAAIKSLADRKRRQAVGQAAAKTIAEQYLVPQIGQRFVDIILNQHAYASY